MRSPQFRKQSGFILKKKTLDSQSGSEDELSSYRAYGRPIHEAHRYVYPSLSKQNLGQFRDYGRNSYEQKLERSPRSSGSSSSDFDKFDMSQSLSYEYGTAGKYAKPQKPGNYGKYEKYSKYETKGKQNKYQANESSFSLSPYEQSDLSDEDQQEKVYRKWQPEPKKAPEREQKWQPDTKKVYDHYVKNPIREESSEQQISVEFRKPAGSEKRQREIIIEQSAKQSRPKWPSKPPAPEFESSQQYSLPKNLESSSNFESIKYRQSPEKPVPSKHHKLLQRKSSSSSSFSLDSDSPERQTKVQHPNPLRDNFIKSDKTATFNKDLKQFKDLRQDKEQKQVKFRVEESDQGEELITEYDTKEFKGGSMKQRVLNAYLSRERDQERRQSRDNRFTRKEIPVDRQSSRKDLQGVHSQQSRQSHLRQHSHSQSHFNTKKSSSGMEQQSRKSREPEVHSREHHKPEMFEVDVKVKHMSLAEAFQIRCGRLRRRLQQERQQFKHGNYAKMFKQMQQQEVVSYPTRTERDQQATRPVNKHAERLAMGIPPVVNRKEMLRVTKKKYKQLPQVKHRVNEEKKKQDLAKRMQQVKKFDREVRLRLKYGGRH